MRWPVLVLRTAHFAVECTAELYDFNPVVAIFAGSDNVLVFLPTPTEFTVGCTSAIRIAFVLPCVQIDLQLEIQLCGAVTAHTHTHTHQHFESLHPCMAASGWHCCALAVTLAGTSS